MIGVEVNTIIATKLSEVYANELCCWKSCMYNLQYHSVIYQENMLCLLFILAVFPILTHQAKFPNPNGKFTCRGFPLES